MFGAELAYVRSQLGKLPPSERKRVAKEIGVADKTLFRLLSKETRFGRTDTVGKLSMYFRTKEKRKK